MTSAPFNTGEPAPFGKAARADFYFDESLTYLNHGAFGACPRPVMAAAQALREEVERQPSEFLVEKLMPHLRNSAETLGTYLGAKGEDIVFLDNASTAINAVLRSLVMFPGDDVLTTSQTYGAVMRTLEFVCDRADARLIPVHLDYPALGEEAIVETILDSITTRTRLLVIDHVTSKTATVLPIAEIASECADRGIPVLVDGAHGPGMLDLNIEKLGVTWYAGNCHKWLGAPRGAAFLWTVPERQPYVRPTTISHFVSDGYLPAFDWPGTKDFTPSLMIGEALAYRSRYGEERLRTHCRDLTIAAGHQAAEALGSNIGVPDGMTGTMTTVRLPASFGPPKPETATEIRRRLREEFGVEVDIQAFEKALWMRLSLYVYNDLSDVERLTDALKAL